MSTMRSGDRRFGQVLVLVTSVALAACGMNRGLTEAETTARLKVLVDGGLAAGLEPQQLAIESHEETDACERSIFSNDGISHVYGYQFPVELLAPAEDAFVDEVGRYWQSQGLLLDADRESDGIRSLFAYSKDGYNLQVMVSHRSGIALVEGSGPCIKGPEE